MEHTFKHADMAQLISVYFKGQENKDVEVKLCNGEDGYISINLIEKSHSNGVTTKLLRRIKKEHFEKIIHEIYECAGRQVTGIINYGEVGSTVIDHGFTKVVTPELANHVVVTTMEKGKVYKKLNN